jgi:hypothetical protein
MSSPSRVLLTIVAFLTALFLRVDAPDIAYAETENQQVSPSADAPPSMDPRTRIEALLGERILDAELPRLEVEQFTLSRLPRMPRFDSLQAWQEQAERIRSEMLTKVVLRGEAASWAASPLRVEYLETIPGGPGYHIRKLRYEAVPGLWIPALLYEPDGLQGRVPVILNVNGHDGNGKSADYKQVRCINQAKRGMLALNVEWLGMGQLKKPNYAHHRMNQLDLCGTSGLAPFYLAMHKGLDVLLAHPSADPARVAVAGLSGGGWQTIFISSLDPRVTLANPVAGYSGFLTRARHHSDLGDSEQTPSDMATVADYLHLTALRAPRPTLLTYNAQDDCCFRADHALPPLVDAAQPIFALHGRIENLRTHVNHDPGTHNFQLDNRQQFYRMLSDFFFPGDLNFQTAEIPCDDEVKTAEELAVDLPADNADFHSLALALAARLPLTSESPHLPPDSEAWQAAGRQRLAGLVRVPTYQIRAIPVRVRHSPGLQATFLWLRTGGDWTVPAVLVEKQRDPPPQPSPIEPSTMTTVIVTADAGRSALADTALAHLDAGHRVLAVDPFYLGESKISSRDYLFALLVACVGERALGIQAGQLSAVARWAADQGGPVVIHAVGPRTSLAALVAAAVEPLAVDGVTLEQPFESLRAIIERNLTVNEMPEVFCFGLLEQFDIPQIMALVAPRRVVSVPVGAGATTDQETGMTGESHGM